MIDFYVYEHKFNSSFRVVVGSHAKNGYMGTEYRTRVYQGQDKQAAIDAAYAGEKRVDIRAQIARFNPTVTRPGVRSVGAAAVAIKKPGSQSYTIQYVDQSGVHFMTFHRVKELDQIGPWSIEMNGVLVAFPGRVVDVAEVTRMYSHLYVMERDELAEKAQHRDTMTFTEADAERLAYLEGISK